MNIIATAALSSTKPSVNFYYQLRAEYLSHLIDGNGLHPNKEIVRAIATGSLTANTELRSFLDNQLL